MMANKTRRWNITIGDGDEAGGSWYGNFSLVFHYFDQ